jgi:methyl-accepting chemotaxis protein
MVARTQEAIGGIVEQVSAINEMIASIVTDAGETAADIGQAARSASALGAEIESLERTAVETQSTSGDLHTVILELGKTIRAFRLERQRDATTPSVAARVAIVPPEEADREDVFDGAFAEAVRLPLGGRAYG